MSDCKDGAENNTDTTDNHVSNAKEGVASSDNGSSRDDDGLGALVLASGETYVEINILVEYTE
jgi:hypothetical protein